MASPGGTPPANGPDDVAGPEGDPARAEDTSAMAQLAAERAAGLERERWLRRQVEHERATLELVAKRVAGALSHESGIRRLWRWLLDDLRSDARERTRLIDGRRDEGLLSRLRAWRERRRAGAGQHSTPAGWAATLWARRPGLRMPNVRAGSARHVLARLRRRWRRSQNR